MRSAGEFARDLAPVVEAVRAEGHTSLRALAHALNARGMLAWRRGRWQVPNVRTLLQGSI